MINDWQLTSYDFRICLLGSDNVSSSAAKYKQCIENIASYDFRICLLVLVKV